MKLSTRLWREYIFVQTSLNQQHTRILLSRKRRKAGKIGMWRRWHRDEAIEREMPRVREIAAQLAHRLPHHLDIRDLEQQGYLGLLQAADRYDPSCGASFSAFAFFRIKGAIIDANRRAAFRDTMADSLDGTKARLGYEPREFADRMPGPDLIIEQRQRAAVVNTAIGMLPPEDQRMLMGSLRGMSTVELGRELHISATAVRQRLREAQAIVGARLRVVLHG